VVGGTVAERQGERWLAPGQGRGRDDRLLAPGLESVRIVPAELGEDVSLVGARPLVAEPPWRPGLAGPAGPIGAR
jgi:hypothetical protein